MNLAFEFKITHKSEIYKILFSFYLFEMNQSLNVKFATVQEIYFVEQLM